MAPACHALTVDPGFHDPETDQVVEADEVGRIAGAEEAAAESVVLDRIHAGGAEDVEERHTVGHGAGAELVDVALHEVVGMFVVAAEHARLRRFIEQGPELLEILRGRAFADEDFLSEGELFPRLVDLETFVVRLDPGGDIFLEVLAAEAGGVTVDPFAVVLGNRDFFKTSGSPWMTPGKFIISER